MHWLGTVHVGYLIFFYLSSFVWSQKQHSRFLRPTTVKRDIAKSAKMPVALTVKKIDGKPGKVYYP